MPIFEYRCRNCSEQFEKIMIGQERTAECPQCGSQETTKLLSTFAVQANSQINRGESGACPCGAVERGMCQGPPSSRN